MSENQNRRGRREAPGNTFPLVLWWRQHRAWVAGLDRKGKLRYRLFQALVILSILIIAVTLFLRSWIQLPEVPDPPGMNLTPGGSTSQLQPGQTGDVSYEGAELPDVAKSGRKPGYYTFLLVGKDTTSGLTDTMMLVTYDTQGKKINAISLLRDTMVNTSGKSGGQKRLNAVYNRNRGDSKLSEKERIENGMTALKKEVSRLTGIYPDFYVMVEWEAIGRLVDAVNGVEFEVPFDMDYDDPYQDLHIHQKKGLRVLDGRDAMEVIRFRKSNDDAPYKIKMGDLERTQIQRDFLTAVLKKCLTPEILLKLPTLVDIFVDNVDTDLTVGNILAFAQLAIGMDVDSGVNFVSMPCYMVSYGGASLVCAQEKELLELLNDGINPYLDEIRSSDLQLMYQKSNGAFGVTNGTLADPAVGRVYVAPKPKPEEPDSSEEPGDTSGEENPDTSTPPDSSGEETPPGDASEPGGTEEPGAVPDPPDIGEIDPGVVFPDPSTDIQNRDSQIAADGLPRAAA